LFYSISLQLYAEVTPGKWPLIHRRQTGLIQLNTRFTTHQRRQQIIRFQLQFTAQAAAQTRIEQPQTGLCQRQTHQYQYAGKPDAEPLLDGFHDVEPAVTPWNL